MKDPMKFIYKELSGEQRKVLIKLWAEGHHIGPKGEETVLVDFMEVVTVLNIIMDLERGKTLDQMLKECRQ